VAHWGLTELGQPEPAWLQVDEPERLLAQLGAQ
jgi:hypothetical protein